ncbi:ISNCY family transposase, partial [Paraburkholderia madseniana]
LAEIDQGAVVEHKRLGHVLQVSQAIQAERDNSRIGKAPSRTHLGAPTKGQSRSPGKKKQCEFTQADVKHAIVDLAQRREVKQQSSKPGRRSARDSGTGVSALPIQNGLFDTA